MPGRSGTSGDRSRRTSTGTRCTTFTKLPDALSGGQQREARAGGAGQALHVALEVAAGRRCRRCTVHRLARAHLADLVLLEVGDHPDVVGAARAPSAAARAPPAAPARRCGGSPRRPPGRGPRRSPCSAPPGRTRPAPGPRAPGRPGRRPRRPEAGGRSDPTPAFGQRPGCFRAASRPSSAPRRPAPA